MKQKASNQCEVLFFVRSSTTTTTTMTTTSTTMSASTNKSEQNIFHRIQTFCVGDVTSIRKDFNAANSYNHFGLQI